MRTSLAQVANLARALANRGDATDYACALTKRQGRTTWVRVPEGTAWAAYAAVDAVRADAHRRQVALAQSVVAASGQAYGRRYL